MTAALAARLGLELLLLPATDDRLRTIIGTPDGEIDFQTYYVRHQHADRVAAIRFDGAELARPAPGVDEALREAAAIVLAPSNPLISIGPILAVERIRELLERRSAPCVAVSPIVAGRALRGPAAAMMESLGHEASPAGVARLYRGLIDVMVLDREDEMLAADVEALGIRPVVADTIMRDGEARTALAQNCARGSRAGAVTIEIMPIAVEGEIAPGDDLAELLLAAAPPLRPGDVVVVSHKAVAKSEGRVVDLATVEPSPRARELAAPDGDPRMAELVLRESRRSCAGGGRC